MTITPIKPGPEQESVWDYPRPPRLEAVAKSLKVVFNGSVVAETTSGWRVLETSHPPVYYFPPQDIVDALIRPAQGGTYCEWKGQARYFDVVVDGRVAFNAAWSYPAPTAGFTQLRDHLAFYAQKMDQCWVGDELARPQPGQFYGGWITDDVVGPFKGEPGSSGW